MKLLLPLAAFALSTGLFADGNGRMESQYSKSEFALTADPSAPHWKNAKGVMMTIDPLGKPIEHRTEARSRWTDKNLYFLFICPYSQLNLKSDPATTTETNKLWEWDVAEIFIGADFDRIRHYREYQVSPQSEWVDLDIDRDHPRPEGGWKWDSGFKVKGRIDAEKKIWYGEMQIPIASIDSRPAKAGNEMRMNLYRLEGVAPNRTSIVWLPTGTRSHHVPESFGRLVLTK